MLDVFKALLTIVKFCYKQDNCKQCSLKEMCGKMPCEW
jgi:hypothetical protein